MRERRILERFDLRLRTRISKKGNPNREVIELVTRNISSGGAFLETDHSLPVGTEFEIEVLLPLVKKSGGNVATTSIKVNGSTIRSDDKGMAVCFDEDYKILPYRGD